MCVKPSLAIIAAKSFRHVCFVIVFVQKKTQTCLENTWRLIINNINNNHFILEYYYCEYIYLLDEMFI